MLEPEFEILKLLNERSSVSQRMISKRIGVSLGKVNSLIKELSLSGYIIKESNDKLIEYKVTDIGMKLLSDNIHKAKLIRLEIHEPSNVRVKTAVILAAGKRKDFNIPVPLLEIYEFKLIYRTIDMLIRNGIKKIIIIVGYKSELFNSVKENYSNVEIVVNEEYKKTGTMQSIANANCVIKEDFILIEGDLIFEEYALKKLIENNIRDCILLTKKSGSGDETFVELRDGYLFKIAKDIHQLNNIHGEVVGITKISYKLFKLMLEEFSNNTNSYINYEYTLLDVARNYNVGFIRLDDLVWGEIDTKEQYEIIKEDIFPKIREKEEREL